jgi:hypothetical protein
VFSVFRLPRIVVAFAALLATFAAAPASAAVTVTFYSKELGVSFPHSFITVEGTLDRGGARIAEDYGFTAKAVSPAVLWGKVSGNVITDHSAGYVKGSDKHFSLTVTDAEYDRLIARIARWRTLKQPSYDLEKQNCVHFVADMAATLGMRVDTSRLVKKPKAFLNAMVAANQPWLSTRGATIHRRS